MAAGQWVILRANLHLKVSNYKIFASGVSNDHDTGRNRSMGHRKKQLLIKHA